MLFNVLSMIIKPGALCTSVHLNTNIICVDGMAVYMCPCILMTIAYVVDYWIFMWQLQYVYTYGYCKIMDKFYVSVHVL